MAKNSEYNLVFWGKSFDEAAATLFITELRQAGLRVKLVGLDGRNPSGAHGLALVPDWTISEAQLQEQNITSIILPCSPTLWHRVATDPRVANFIQTTHTNGTSLVVREMEFDSSTKQKAFDSLFTVKHVITYPVQDKLLPFIRNLVTRMLPTSSQTRSAGQAA